MTRNLLIAAAALVATSGFAAASFAADMVGDADAGKAKAVTCGACHGADGNSVNAEWPSLAGQHEDYLVARLKGYQSGEINNAVMAPMAAGLSEQDMHDLGAHFNGLAVKPGAADPELVDAGSHIYRLGNDKTEVAACAACHGPRGHGNPAAMMPAVAGQRATYTINQLKAFANGTRYGGTNGMMADVAKAMSDDEMKAVASYLEGLH